MAHLNSVPVPVGLNKLLLKAQLVVVSSERKLAIVIPLYFWVSLAATKVAHPTQDKSVSDFDVVKLVIG